MKTQFLPIIAAMFGVLALSSANAAEPEHKMDHGDHCGMPMGEGTLNAVDIKKSKANISHGAIDPIGWPAMTMDFAVLKAVDLAAFAPGERIHFLLKRQKDKTYAVAAVCSLDVDEGAHEACMAQMHDTAMKAAADAGMPCSMDGMDTMKHMDHRHRDDPADDDKQDHAGHH